MNESNISTISAHSSVQPSLDSLRAKLEALPDLNKVGLGWLRFTCSVEYLTYWRKSIHRYFGVELLPRPKGWNGYLESLQGSYSILIAYTPTLTEAERRAMGIKKSPNEGLMTVDIPQSALDSLSGLDLLKFWLDVYGCPDARLTRADIYYDDYCKLIQPETLHNACKRGGVGVPRVENMRGWDEYNVQSGKNQGYTLYFGSPKSEKQVRYYDKFAESGGTQDCYRLEVQLTGKQAEAFQDWFAGSFSEACGLRTLADTLAAIGNSYKEVIKGSIAFYDIPPGLTPRELPQNWASRCELTWWWREMLAGLEPAKLTIDRKKPSLSSTVVWLNQQVSPALSLVRSAFQQWSIPFTSWLERFMEEGEARWSDRHFKMLQEAVLTSPAT